MEDILLIDKPKGITSFDCIRILRRELGVRKMGHAGTLDPLASGLMIIGIGKGTKKLNAYLKLPKSYKALIRLGMRTETGDLEGRIVEGVDMGKHFFEEYQIQEAVQSLVGESELAVPKYSAIKKDGKALYAYAREGKEIEIPVKKMVVRSAWVQKIDTPDIEINFDVESGVYIRSLAEELGRRLGVPATLADLRRLSIGKFDVADAHKLKTAS